MNKKAIWGIIGLMSAALIGIVWLQTYWIREAIKLNEVEFDKNVFVVLNNAASKLQYMENASALDVFNTTDISETTYFQQEVYQRIKGDQYMAVGMTITQGETHQADSLLSNALNDKGECNCPECQYERKMRLVNVMSVNRYLNQIPLAERINLQYLDAIITQELENQGMRINFDYGVFSTRKKSLVIKNGHFLVEDDSPKITQAGEDNLHSSKYHVNLFQQDMFSPGLLMIHFPARASVVWGPLWRTLMSAIVFTGIILFCFIYTIQVIFRQKKLSEMKTDFINNMTHEFKTPIATISLAADSITSPMVSGSQAKVTRFADIIKQENKRMLSQVEKVLQMAQIDKKEFQLNLTAVNMHDVINQAVGNTNLQVAKKGGTVTADLKAESPIVEGDLTHVSNIIHNLLDNANKYSPEKPEISVHTRNVANGVEVIVKDRGIGMGKEARKHIFDKFFRVHTGDRHDVKGFGLGLSYVKALMTAHNGQIEVKSELGKGSSFILLFPTRVNNG